MVCYAAHRDVICPELASDQGGPQSIVDAAIQESYGLLFIILQLILLHPNITSSDRSHAITITAMALAAFPSAPEAAPRYFKATLEDWFKDAEPRHREKIVNLFGSEYLTVISSKLLT